MITDRHTDVLVIGGGIIGLACAYYLMKEGRHVRIIEKDTIGSGASYGNCGLVFISGLLPLCAPGTMRHELSRMIRGASPVSVLPGFDMGRLVWLLNFTRKCTADHMMHAIRIRANILHHSRLLYESLFADEHIDGALEKKGVLMVFKGESEWQAHGRTNKYLKPYGLEAHPVRGDALRDLEPTLRGDLYGGWHHTADSHLRPDAFLREWKALLIRDGTVIEENCALQEFITMGTRIRGAMTSRGEFTAATYVLAAGAWTPEIVKQLHVRIPMQPGKGYSITMARPPRCPTLPCYFYEKRVVATPWKSGFRLGGILEFSGFNNVIYKKRIQNLKNTAREYMNLALAEQLSEEWVGLRPMTYDDLPIIDRVPRHPDLILATGHGMMGISMASSTGRLVSEMITGCDLHLDPTPLRLSRF